MTQRGEYEDGVADMYEERIKELEGELAATLTQRDEAEKRAEVSDMVRIKARLAEESCAKALAAEARVKELEIAALEAQGAEETRELKLSRALSALAQRDEALGRVRDIYERWEAKGDAIGKMLEFAELFKALAPAPERSGETPDAPESDWHQVGDGAFARPFGTVRVCVDCGCLVAGGPTRCARCARDMKEPAPEPAPKAEAAATGVSVAAETDTVTCADRTCARFSTGTNPTPLEQLAVRLDELVDSIRSVQPYDNTSADSFHDWSCEAEEIATELRAALAQAAAQPTIAEVDLLHEHIRQLTRRIDAAHDAIQTRAASRFALFETTAAQPAADPSDYDDMSRDDAIRYAEFWRKAGTRWQEWAHELCIQPEMGLLGDDGAREQLGRRLKEQAAAQPLNLGSGENVNCTHCGGLFRCAPLVAARDRLRIIGERLKARDEYIAELEGKAAAQPSALPDAGALAAAVQAFVDMTERWHEENGDLLVAQDGDLVGVYKHPPEYLAMKAALLPTAPPAETAEFEALKACVAFVVEYLSDDDRDFAERDSWCDMCEALDQAGHNVFELADRARAQREAAGGGKA